MHNHPPAHDAHARNHTPQEREALARRISHGIPVIHEDAWKYALTDKVVAEHYRAKAMRIIIRA